MKLFKNSPLWIICLVIFLNPWFWVITQRNLPVTLISFVLSIVAFGYLFKKRSLLPVALLSLILILISLNDAFDESIFRNSALDIQKFHKRHEYYANGLGKIYTNRIALEFYKDFSTPLYKLQKNFFSNLDLNLYFFASHPRERVGIEEFSKYWLPFLPFLLIGLISLIYKPFKGFLIYILFISLVSSFISPKYNLGPILFFPIVNNIITMGILSSLRKIGIKNENQ